MKSPKFGLVDLAIVVALADSLPEKMRSDTGQVRTDIAQICSGSQRPFERVMTPHALAAIRWTQVARNHRARTRRIVG